MAEPTPMELDMENRDPNDLNDHIKSDWPDLFGEPDGVHSFNCVWRNSYKVYFHTKLWCYKICSAICAIPFSFCWGIYFACMAFMYVWYLTPCVKAYMVQLGFASKLWTVQIKAFCDPCFESCSNIFSKCGKGGGSPA